jgi:hypothetical protein
MSLLIIKISRLCTKNALMANFCRRQQSIVRRSLRRAPDIFVGILAKFGVSEQIFIKVRGIKFHENPFSESRAATWRLDELIDMAESVRGALLRGG